MPLQGTALLVIWNDVDASAAREYDRWITQEHMPERMQAPGFMRGRRYVAPDATVRQPYLNMYELSDIEACTSAAYQAMLQAPSPWTRKMMPQLRDFSRAALRTVYSRGSGLGGCMGSIQLDAPAAPSGDALGHALEDVLRNGADGVVGVHVGEIDTAAAGGLTSEKRLRGSTAQEAEFTHAVLIESVDEDHLRRALPEVAARLAASFGAARVVNAGVYRFNLVL